MDDIVLHPQVALNAGQFLQQPAHAVVLLGPAGSGKFYLAQVLASRLLGCDTSQVSNQPYFRHVTAEKDKSSIGIETVRELQQFTKLKLPSATSRRVVVIEAAHTLTAEAQNALLKLLEEPPQGTFMILTASSGQALLPTIRSRSQQLLVHLPPPDSLVDFYRSKGFDTTAIQQAASLSGGLPGLMHALLLAEDHPMRAAVDTARKLLQSSQFERLAMVDAMAKQKPETLQVLFVLQHMARAATAKAGQAAPSNPAAADKSIRQWHKIMKAAYEADHAYSVSAQAKLTLTTLMLSL